jgi:predicted amidohydrolase
VRICLLQNDPVWEDPEASHRGIERLLDAAMAEGPPDLVALPEMCATGFSMNARAIREPEDGPTHRFLRDLARTRSIHLLGTVVEESRTDPRLGRNTALLYAPDGDIVARYTKIHPFSFLDEDRHYEKGDRIVTVDVAGFRAAIFICYDLRFPESFRRATLEQGANLFLVPANWPTDRAEHWDLLLRSRAVENLAYVAGINRTGSGGGLRFDGRSQVIDPTGKVLARRTEGAGAVFAEIEVDRLRETRERFPFLDDA